MSRNPALHRQAARLVFPLLLFAVVTAVAVSAAGAQSLSLKLWSDRGDGAVYKPGDPINIAVKTNRDANVLVYEIDAEGAVHLLYPTQPNNAGIEGGTVLELPEDPAEQLVVEGPTGEGYIVAIATEDPFRQLPWYLRPPDARAEELGYTTEDRADDGVTSDGKIVGDPFVAMERIRRQVLADASDAHSFTTAYVSYYVHERVRYPRYLCNDCHRPGYYSWWDGFDPYYANCSVFEFRINSNWWWGPTYWYGYVPYYAYVYRTNCPPRYRPPGPGGVWYSSWDGWRRWKTLWNGPLRRVNSAPPTGYVAPSRWDQTWAERGSSRPRPPGFLVSAHEGWSRSGTPGSTAPSSGIRRERREGGVPSGGEARPWLREGGSRTAPETGRSRSGWSGSSGGASSRPERGTVRGAQKPDPGSREGRSSSPPADPGRWTPSRQEPAPTPARDNGRGSQREERPREVTPPSTQSSPPASPPPSPPARPKQPDPPQQSDPPDRPQRSNDNNSPGRWTR